MARILVTGSAQGIGSQCAKELIAGGHSVVVHARNEDRAQAAREANPRAAAVVIGRFDSLASTQVFGDASCEQGRFDAIVHNAALGPHSDERVLTGDDMEQVFQVNVVAPYVLTCTMPLPDRLIFVGSDAHEQGQFRLDDVNWEVRTWDGSQAYADSKLYLTMLAAEIAQRYPSIVTTAVHPGWVRTAMGGPNATKSLAEGAHTLTELAGGDDARAELSGSYLVDGQPAPTHPSVADPQARAALIAALEELTGMRLPKKKR